jgi:hypothetical protein
MMAANRSNPMVEDDQEEEAEGGLTAPYRPSRRRMARVLVPVGVAGVAAASIGLVPALASDSSPTLSEQSPQQLVAKVLSADVQSFSGTVQVTGDLGIPEAVLSGVTGGRSQGSGMFGGRSTAGSGEGGDSTAADPTTRLAQLLAGTHTLQVAVDGPDRQRLGLLDRLAQYEIVHNGTEAWGWDSTTNRAVHFTLPERAAAGDGAKGAPGTLFGTAVPTTPQEAATRLLAMSGPTTSITVGGTSRVAGRNAYELSVKPKQSGSTIGEVRIAVDSANGAPLRVVVTPSGTDEAAFDVHFASVSFSRPAVRVFDFNVPKGAEVTEQKAAGGSVFGVSPGEARSAANGPTVTGEGWTGIAEFKLPANGADGSGAQETLALAKSLGKQVAGGTLISTRLVNVLIGDNGTVYAGAVSQQVLQRAAGAR